MKKVFTPGLKLVVFGGDTERKLWEAKDRVTPILNHGDYALLPQNIAALLCRKNEFNIVEGIDLFASEKEEGQNHSPLALTDDEIKLIVEKYLSDNNLVAYAKSGLDSSINTDDSESKPTPPSPPGEAEVLASILIGLDTGEFKEENLSEYEKELLTKERQRLIDILEPTLDLENISQLENFETKDELTEQDKELSKKERQRVLDEQEPTLDLENISQLESFETKDDLEVYGLTFGINLIKTKKLENMYADLLAHIETLKTK